MDLNFAGFGPPKSSELRPDDFAKARETSGWCA